jgi:hypothetical protein
MAVGTEVISYLINKTTMTRDPFTNALTGAPRRAAKRQRTKNSRWMHLGVAEIGSRQKIQRCWARHTLATTNSLFLAGDALTLVTVFFGPIPAPMQLMIDLIFCQASLYAHHVTMWSTLDGQLYDIPLTEWLYTRNIAQGSTSISVTSRTICRPW